MDDYEDIMQMEIVSSIERVEKFRLEYEAGNLRALPFAIKEFTDYPRPMPNWLRKAYSSAFDSVVSLEVNGWDDVFGKQIEKGQQREAQKRNLELAPKVYSWISRYMIENPTTKIDEALFEAAGEEFGVSKTTANKLFYMIDNGTAAKLRDFAVINAKNT